MLAISLENGYKTLYASGTPDGYRLKDLPLYYDAIIIPFLCLCIHLYVYINVHVVLQYFNQCYQIKEVKPPQKCPEKLIKFSLTRIDYAIYSALNHLDLVDRLIVFSNLSIRNPHWT